MGIDKTRDEQVIPGIDHGHRFRHPANVVSDLGNAIAHNQHILLTWGEIQIASGSRGKGQYGGLFDQVGGRG
jgi:hypothetical protein